MRLLGGLLTLRLVRNPGAAFGMAQGLTIAFTWVARGRRRGHPADGPAAAQRRWAVALGLVLGGRGRQPGRPGVPGAGPGRGHVVDFLELPRWPVFNLADSAIVDGGVLMVLLSARGMSTTERGATRGRGAGTMPPSA